MRRRAPRTSVLLPTHNRADVLRYAIASVLAQTDADLELLIVADGCTDNTRAVVASFDDPRIRLFDLPKAPYFGYANRNVALRQARGKLVAFAPHDDIWLPDHLALMRGLLERSGAPWGYSRPLWVSTEGIIVPASINLMLPDELQVFLEQGNTIPTSSVVHTRAILEEAGFWPEDIASAADWELWRRMVRLSGGRVAHLRQPTTLHFTANWRQPRFSAFAPLQTLLGIAESSAWWPAILRHSPQGEPEQAVIWRAMQAGGAGWSGELRSAVDAVLDRLAWMTACGLWPSVQAALAGKAQAEAELAALRQEIDARR